MNKYNIADSYRSQNTWGGYTWGRNNPQIQRSRLDYILTPIIDIPHITTSFVTKYPNESDHFFLYTSLTRAENIIYGPGIIRCNSSLTDNKETKQIIAQEITASISKHNSADILQRWDNIKMDIRQIYLKQGKIQAKKNKTHLQYANEEISRLEKKNGNLTNQGKQSKK